MMACAGRLRTNFGLEILQKTSACSSKGMAAVAEVARTEDVGLDAGGYTSSPRRGR